MEPKDIEHTLKELSNSLGVSTAKLRAIYFRGVKECLSEGYDGSPSVYGLARIQRYAMAVNTNNLRLTPDQDFVSKTLGNSDTVSYEITADSENGWALIYDVMSSEGKKIAEEFPPGSVEQTVYDIDRYELSVLGTHNKVQWTCTLNLSTGDSTFSTSID